MSLEVGIHVARRTNHVDRKQREFFISGRSSKDDSVTGPLTILPTMANLGIYRVSFCRTEGLGRSALKSYRWRRNGSISFTDIDGVSLGSFGSWQRAEFSISRL